MLWITCPADCETLNREFFPEVFQSGLGNRPRCDWAEPRVTKMRIPANKIAASQTIASDFHDGAPASKTAENTEETGPNASLAQGPKSLAPASYSNRQKRINGPPIVQAESSAAATNSVPVEESGGRFEDLLSKNCFPIAQFITASASNQRVMNIAANPIVRRLTAESIPASMIMGQLLAVVKAVCCQLLISNGNSSALPLSCATNKNCNASRSSDSGA